MKPVPKPGELRELPAVRKPEARSVTAWFVFAFLRVMRHFGNEWATVVYEQFKQHLRGVVYWYDREPSESLRGHESVHEWQGRRFWFHGLRYLLSKRYRRHAEAMACAFEVVVHGRHPEERAALASNPVYRMNWSRAEARALIGSYAAAFRAAGWGES